MRSSIACPMCGEIVSKTHRMQTVQAQLVAHLRTHSLTIKDAKRRTYKAIAASDEAQKKLLSVIFPKKA